MNLSKEDKKYIWLTNHIKICNLYDIERFMFSSTDLLKSIKEQSNYNDYSLTIKTNGYLQNKKVKTFKKSLINKTEKLKTELHDRNLI